MSRHSTRSDKNGGTEEHTGLTLLGSTLRPHCNAPDASILESFTNSHPGRNYVITFEYPEFTSLCPITGQPDFGAIFLRYAPDARCVESKSFKLYMGAFRNHGAFMENLTNRIADDLISVLAPRRITVEGMFNTRGGTRISIRVEHLAPSLSKQEKQNLLGLW